MRFAREMNFTYIYNARVELNRDLIEIVLGGKVKSHITQGNKEPQNRIDGPCIQPVGYSVELVRPIYSFPDARELVCRVNFLPRETYRRAICVAIRGRLSGFSPQLAISRARKPLRNLDRKSRLDR